MPPAALAAPPAQGDEAGEQAEPQPAQEGEAKPAAETEAEEEAPPGPMKQVELAIDRGAGVFVSALGTALFYDPFARSAEVTHERVIVEVGGVGALVEELEGQMPIDEASFTLTIPEDALSKEQAEDLQAKLNARFTPTAPTGTRSFTVVRDDKAEGTRLSATAGGMPLIALWLLIGATFFTFRFGFINVRAFAHAIQVTRGIYDNPEDEGEVSHFQALASALSATVGLGNIAGVAIAVTMGGPGAIFWMILAGLLGMSSKFTESTLAQKYREVRPDGRVLGGPMFYLSKGLKDAGFAGFGRVLAGLFAVLCVAGSLGGGNTFQVSQSLGVVQEQFPSVANFGWLYGLVMTGLVAIVIIGGISRIAATAEKIVPTMVGIYVVACLYILFSNAGQIPTAFGKIFGEAFTPAAGYGGFVGVMVMGIRRAAFSNEAGVGSAAIAHSAAKTEYAVREGIVSLLEPFIDTVVVCTMTGLVIVITGAYDDPSNNDLIGAANGAALTSRAMAGQISWFPYLLLVAVVLFAYSTMISWSYYGERCWVYLFGDRSSMVYRIIFLLFVFLGSVITATNILNFGDLMILSMAVPNVLGMYFLTGYVKKDLDQYMSDLRAGKFKRYE